MRLETDQVVQVLLRERLRIMAAAAAVVRDPHAADDVFQQVVLTALEGRADLDTPAHVLAWALRTARHRAIDITRRKKLEPLSDEILSQLEAEWAGTDDAVSDQVEALRRCLGLLAESSRELLRLRYQDGQSVAAIAGRLRRTTDAVYQALFRIHKAVRACVESDRPATETIR